jgi:hypothetical protein
MKKTLLLLLFIAGTYTGMSAQRYLNDVFTRSQIQVTSSIEYGQNYYFLAYPPAPTGASASNPLMGPLLLDLYEPSSDTAARRPLVIHIHTGSFLPRLINGQTTGDKLDSAVVEICNRWAMKGYVAAAVQYRLGWNPLATTQAERTAGILNAVYRTIHDVQTAVRFFKKNADSYKIDPNRIFLVGQGSGGYVSLAYNFLNKQSETELPKFLVNGASVVNPLLVGYVDGTGGQFNNYNHPGYSNDVAMVTNMGGSIGDISWMEGSWMEKPTAAIHCRKDMYAPFDSGTVIVPTTGNPVVFVQGSRAVIKKAVSVGINDLWVNHNFTDPYSQRAYSLNPKAQYEGLFQIDRPTNVIGASTYEEGSPWEWWDSATVVAQATAVGLGAAAPVLLGNALETNPDMSKAKATAYIDTIVGFLAPRMYLVVSNPNTGVKQNKNEINFTFYPNPATDVVNITLTDNNLINRVVLFDLRGSIVREVANIKAGNTTLSLGGIASGVYILGVQSDKGTATRQLIIK